MEEELESIPGLLSLPQELLEEILVLCDPVDVAMISETCMKMWGIVYGYPLSSNFGVVIVEEDDSGITMGKEKNDKNETEIEEDKKKNVEEEEEEKKKRKLSRRGLWRGLYLAQLLDDPRECVDWIGIRREERGEEEEEEEEEVDWQDDLKKIIRARTVVNIPQLCKSETELQDVLKTFLELVKWVPPLSSKECVADLSKNLLWVPAVLKEFLDVILLGVRVSNTPTTTEGETQETETEVQWKVPPEELWKQETKLLHAHLHTLYGLTKNDIRPSMKSHIQSLAYVYDMRKYKAETDYGPLLKDGRVNWVHIQKIHHVASMHVVGAALPPVLLSTSGGDDEYEYEYIIYPMSMPFTQILVPGERGVKRSIPLVEAVGEIDNRIATGNLPENGDWVGVEGRWKVMFCFCDHRDLIELNESAESDDGPLDISLFEQPGLTEVFRTIDANLHVTRIADDPMHPGRPLIGFVGEINPPASTSTMYGYVQLTPDDHIKWQFYSGDGGRSIWSSVGIQVGGIGSSFGVLGAWTTVFHDTDDPVGPMWMQKV